MHTFTTKRLIIRPLDQQDKRIYCELYTNAKTMMYISKPFNLQQAKNAFAIMLKKTQIKDKNFITWVITDRYNQTPLGIASLYKKYANELLAINEVGIMLLPSFIGKNYAKETLEATIMYSFNCLSLESINFRYNRNNAAMAALCKKFNAQNDPTSHRNSEHEIKNITNHAFLTYLNQHYANN
ncbi:GNAT family N-acetyltransferase [Thalassotalea sp. PLHSN55]|uniref:GNAT family N-acetyltransferase n=1 Tax=Thalassotalea sp. PLHSN55 TaxID=3435888 RepID=UPI003F82BE21